ncbi:MAG: N-acetyltransferase [Clostridia bacterium]|nr:N-acetyltransferase [Clostridia bacterium]
MIKVTQVVNARQRKEFIDFPLELYRGNRYFVPPLYGDEKKIFTTNNIYADTCESVFFLAYRDGTPVGRISGIIQKAANRKSGEKRVRFTRFDCIEDFDVAKALFKALEEWASSKGMDTVCGPLGYSDLEREGLLVDGFDQLSTFEEQYNYEYYGGFIEKLGYKKEVDWYEFKLYLPEKEKREEVYKLSEYVMKRYKLHYGEAENVRDFINKYADGFFELLDRSYDDLYGTVPFTESMKKMIISNFILLVDLEHVAVVLDENDRLVCLGVCFPSIAEAVQSSGGHLTPATILNIFRSKRKPKIIDLGLVGVDAEYINKGIPAIVCARIMDMLQKDGIDHIETNLNLENNYSILNMWKRFDCVRHKQRRAYVKTLQPDSMR